MADRACPHPWHQHGCVARTSLACAMGPVATTVAMRTLEESLGSSMYVDPSGDSCERAKGEPGEARGTGSTGARADLLLELAGGPVEDDLERILVVGALDVGCELREERGRRRHDGEAPTLDRPSSRAKRERASGRGHLTRTETTASGQSHLQTKAGLRSYDNTSERGEKRVEGETRTSREVSTIAVREGSVERSERQRGRERGTLVVQRISRRKNQTARTRRTR